MSCHAVLSFAFPPSKRLCAVQSTIFDNNIGDGHNVWIVNCMFWILAERCEGLNISVEGWQGVSGKEGSQVMEQPGLWSAMSDYSEV